MNRQRTILHLFAVMLGICLIATGVGMFVQGARVKKAAEQQTTVTQPAVFVPESYPSGERNRLIIVGASRVVLMNRAVTNDSDTIYIARSGKGFYWLLKQALPQLDAWLTLFPESTVVFQMGNNDFHKWFQDNRELYFRLYRRLIDRYPEAKIRLMDILPDKNAAYDKYAVSFNNEMHRRFPDESIGGHEEFYQMKLAFLKDGSHYTPQSSRHLYDYIVKSVQGTFILQKAP